MEILNDTTETKVVHTRTVKLSNAPAMKSGNFYFPDQLWYAETLTIEWVGDTKPTRIVATGTTEDHVGIERSYSWDRMPQWMREVVDPAPVMLEVPKVQETKALVKPKLVRHKVGDRSYSILTRENKLVGTAVMTGEHGRDNYPWEWSLTDDLTKQMEESDAPKHHKSSGSSDTLRDIIDMMATKIARYDLKP